jgi:hypothetical protein
MQNYVLDPLHRVRTRLNRELSAPPRPRHHRKEWITEKEWIPISDPTRRDLLELAQFIVYQRFRIIGNCAFRYESSYSWTEAL